MSNFEPALRLAIVGLGPRGLGALEALAKKAIQHQVKIQIDIFDPYTHLGAGPNFCPDQSDLCILNIPTRALDIDTPKFLRDYIGDFTHWSSIFYQPDDFPARSDLGNYLTERYHALRTATANIFDISHINKAVCTLEKSTKGWKLRTDRQEHGPYNEILMTQGQPETAVDPQISKWEKHANAYDFDLCQAYPANNLIAAARNWSDKSVAIRGLGLSTFDVIRMLTLGQGGKFENDKYVSSNREPARILPFSFNGRPPAAKPATADYDDKFNPKPDETERYLRALDDATCLKPDPALAGIVRSLIPPALRVAEQLGSSFSQTNIQRWLDQELDDSGSQNNQDAKTALQTDIEMAHGRLPPSIGYIIGQIWRKWQNELRISINPAQISSKTIAAIIQFDEGLKRFSYGPPVSASEQLLTLVKQDIVTFSIVDDPDIILNPRGWQLVEGDDLKIASVMVDAVLPSPIIKHVTDPLVKQLRSQGIVHAVSNELGADICSDGQLKNSNGETQTGLSMLGRLALGSVIAVDSLHDCFGASTDRWADGIIKRTGEAVVTAPIAPLLSTK